MAEDIIAAPLGENRVASTTGGGTALSTTAAFIPFPTGSGPKDLVLIPRNFSTAVVARYTLNPYLIVGLTTDALVATGNFTDGSANMQDGDTTTVLTLNSFNTAANNNFLYVGSHVPFRGVRVIIGNTNSNASTLTVKYWNGTAWTDITATDNTAGGGATFNATGNVTWTVPTAWAANRLSSAGTAATAGIGDTSLVAIGAAKINIAMENTVYWTRWETSAQFDASVTATGMLSMNRSTTYDEIPSGSFDELRAITHQYLGTGCIEALTDAGTANLVVKIRTIGIGSKFA